jgi:hypothetical protein
MNMDSFMQPFWMVLNERTNYTQFRHDTADSAITEAKRLAAANKGQKFFVLCAVGMAVVEDPVKYVAVDPIPF